MVKKMLTVLYSQISILFNRLYVWIGVCKAFAKHSVEDYAPSDTITAPFVSRGPIGRNLAGSAAAGFAQSIS